MKGLIRKHRGMLVGGGLVGLALVAGVGLGPHMGFTAGPKTPLWTERAVNVVPTQALDHARRQNTKPGSSTKPGSRAAVASNSGRLAIVPPIFSTRVARRGLLRPSTVTRRPPSASCWRIAGGTESTAPSIRMTL